MIYSPTPVKLKRCSNFHKMVLSLNMFIRPRKYRLQLPFLFVHENIDCNYRCDKLMTHHGTLYLFHAVLDFKTTDQETSEASRHETDEG